MALGGGGTTRGGGDTYHVTVNLPNVRTDDPRQLAVKLGEELRKLAGRGPNVLRGY